MSKDTMRTFPIETQMRKIGGKSKRNESKLDFGKRFYLKFEITLLSIFVTILNSGFYFVGNFRFDFFFPNGCEIDFVG